MARDEAGEIRCQDQLLLKFAFIEIAPPGSDSLGPLIIPGTIYVYSLVVLKQLPLNTCILRIWYQNIVLN